MGTGPGSLRTLGLGERRRALLVGTAWIVVCSASIVDAQQLSASKDSVRWTQITYLSGASVYVSAGRDDGLTEGTTLDVVRRGAIIAALRAVDLSSHRAACTIVRGDQTQLNVGDSVRFFARTPQPTATPDSEMAPAMEPRHDAWRTFGIRGRLGVRYLMVAQRDSLTGKFSQPAADIRIEGQRLGGTPIGVSIDAHGRRTYMSRPDSAHAGDRTFVYSLSGSYTNPSGVRVGVGRQFSEAFANVSLYDGISADVGRERWRTGMFAGTQPAPSTMSPSADVRELGAYVQAHNATGEQTHWSATVGAIGSYHTSVPNREFGFAQIVIAESHFSLYATQEIDYNRDWKTAAGEPTLQPTSTFVHVQLQPTEQITVYGGFDSRRNIRLWRNLVSPETEFDDRFRTGAWAGASLLAGGMVRLATDLRSSDGGVAGGRAVATGGSISLRPIGPNVSAQARTTSYRSPLIEGWLHSASVSVAPGEGLFGLEAEGGLRNEHDRSGAAVTGTVGESRVWWAGLTADVSLGRSWFLALTATRTTGGWDSADQVYASATWRF